MEPTVMLGTGPVTIGEVLAVARRGASVAISDESLAAIAAAVVLFSPRVAMHPVRIVDANAPPPPLEPRGERFTV